MKDYRGDIVDAGKKMLSSGLTVGTWGNISICDRENNRVYLTPSGMPYNSLVVDDIPVLTINGDVIDAKRKPTIEKDLHLGVYQNFKTAGAVIHTHPKWSMIFSCIHKEIPLVCDEAAQILSGSVKCAEYALPGSAELAKNCIKALKHSNACLLASHGAVCVGTSLSDAFNVATVLEYTAELYYKVLSIGEKPFEISKKDIEFMYEFVHTKYGQR